MPRRVTSATSPSRPRLCSSWLCSSCFNRTYFQLHHGIAFVDLIALFDSDRDNLATLRRWYFHRGLIGLQCNNAVTLGYNVAWLN